MRLRSSTVFFFLLIAQWTIFSAGKSVETRLYSKWTATSLLAEISEVLADGTSRNFWKFLDNLHERIGNDSSNSCLKKGVSSCKEQFQYDMGMSIAEEIIDGSEMKLARLALSMRIMSPRVEAHHQLGAESKPEECSAFIQYREQKGCSLNQLKLEKITGNEVRTYAFDHVFPGNSSASKTLFIYGTIGSRELKTLITDATNLVATDDDFRFVVRHLKPESKFDSPDDTLVSLSGYGVELALKNTEYKAQNTEKATDEPEDLHGFNIGKLRENHQNLEKELESLRDHLQKIDEIAPLKPWQLLDLGFKTCQKLRNDGNLASIEKLLHDFPTHARAISHDAVDEKLREIVKKYQEVMKQQDIETGTNVLAINGRVVATGSDFIDVFSIIEAIKQEKRAIDTMAVLGFKPETDFSEVLTLFNKSPVKLSNYAFDYRGTVPAYLNNLEASPGRYTSLELLLQPFPPGQIRPISRNIFTLVLFSDPFDSDDKVFEQIKLLAQAGIYIRFGVVPIFDERKSGMTIQSAVEKKQVAKHKRRLWPTTSSLLGAIQRGNRFVKSTGITKTPFALLNGYHIDLTDWEKFDELLESGIEWQTTRLQYSLFRGTLNNKVKISDWWLDEETNSDIVQRANQRVTAAFSEKKYVKDDGISARLTYFSETPDIISKNAVVNTWIIADFENPIHRMFAAEVFQSEAVKDKNKVALIPNPENVEKMCDHGSISHFLTRYGTMETQDVFKVLTSGIVPGNRIAPWKDEPCSADIFKSLLSQFPNLTSKEIVVVSNGLVVGPLTEDELITAEDMDYLVSIWKKKNAEKVSKFLDRGIGEDVSIRFYSVLSRIRQQSTSVMSFESFKDPKHKNMLKIPPAEPTLPAVTVTWIANPLSREAQQIISLLKLIGKTVNARIEIIFNPIGELSEMPVKRFYRFVASNELFFDDDGSVRSHVSSFENLPQKQLLTMTLETSDSWMIEVKRAEYDLDNILLNSIKSNVEGIFSLEHILVEGQSSTSDGSPSAGVEVELQSGSKVYDTIVMLNLGYFQLKAEPGVWSLQLRKGNTTDKHQLTHFDSEKVNGSQVDVVMDSLTGKMVKLVVDELDETEEDKPSTLESFMQSAKNFFSSESKPSDVINVFSLASGHLYERLMRIMMVSVMRNTESKKVKFWLLKNYLSPKFKETIPSLSKSYEFEYEFVEYKWPKWLHRQTEKQRVMWGYKILFLDVLFPLNVDKIIFVDADQVVRADLQELMDYDLKGAPYGYVPFCESRQKMEGFRFWKSGYWKQHLMGRRYHISALYVVDLKKFRQFAAGDRLRGRYSSLSSDPNSLSNLDQDLPNNMIHEVPIRSLPQEWLWCETWCDDESKESAKTIDLCNNPLTKEPKLSSARRIIGEWQEIDEQIHEVIDGKAHLGEELKDEL